MREFTDQSTPADMPEPKEQELHEHLSQIYRDAFAVLDAIGWTPDLAWFRVLSRRQSEAPEP